MPRFIIHHEGAYNIFSTIVDAPLYDRGMTRQELEEVIRYEHGQQGINELESRLERAHETGCSGHGYTLDDCIKCNRAGPQEARLFRDEFIRLFLTLPS
jgi:hypothetical protein